MATPEEHARRDEQFERELQLALRRVDAPASLASFLTITAEQETRAQNRRGLLSFRPQARKPVFPARWSPLLGIACAASLAIACLAAESVHLHREKERALATQQFAQATAITDRALERAREKLERAGVQVQE
ncbi:MAG: hypothetical protein PW735_09240 [Acidobacteriaceae bacterium]|nr:hypothetical protein [Acidobacteriaceae bacterium]